MSFTEHSKKRVSYFYDGKRRSFTATNFSSLIISLNTFIIKQAMLEIEITVVTMQ